MTTKNKGLDVTYGLVVKHSVDTDILIWAIWYQRVVLGIPYKKISKSSLNKFLKHQMYQFGCGEFLVGTSWTDEEISDDTYTNIENTINRIFFKE